MHHGHVIWKALTPVRFQGPVVSQVGSVSRLKGVWPLSSLQVVEQVLQASQKRNMPASIGVVGARGQSVTIVGVYRIIGPHSWVI